MNRYTARIDRRNACRRYHGHLLVTVFPYVPEKSCFTGTGLTGKKKMLVGLVHKCHRLLENGIGSIRLLHSFRENGLWQKPAGFMNKSSDFFPVRWSKKEIAG